MAYSVREERQSLATSLREDLDEAERVIIQLRRDNVESFLQLLDSIDEALHTVGGQRVGPAGRSRRAGAVCTAGCSARPAA